VPSKVHTVYRTVRTGIGNAFATPVKVYDDSKLADEALKANAQALAEIIEGNIIIRTEKGPRAVMTVKQLLAELGISGWSYSVLEQEVHQGLIVTPTAAIIQ